MTSNELLQDAVAALGYGDSNGYVHDASNVSGARGFIWSDLQQKCGVDAAFFKGAVPVVAFAATASRADALRIQRRLWNYGRVPMLIATTENEVLALSCNTAGSRENPDAALLGHAQLGHELAQVLADFTRFSVESGRLTALHGSRLDKRNRIDQALLRNLRELRLRLLRAEVSETDVEPLLGRSIFIRYLEDRGILQAKDLIELGQPGSFVSALEQGWDAVTSFFEAMSDHFHGDVFRRDGISRPVPPYALSVLADFFRATELESGQQALWSYDFSIIPPELISSIYEQLLVTKQKTDAAYYTPRHVVDLVLDELFAPDWWSHRSRTILDPACGSGIFLTEAFRRMVHQRTLERDAPPTFDELAELLVESVFGIDRNADAIGVAAFGLYLALLEHVDPRTVWLSAELPDLIGTNLIVADFFDDHPLAQRKFDAIAGNPPWQSRLSAPAASYIRHSTHSVPDQQIAVAFVWRAAEMLSGAGLAGLVLPSKTMLHNRLPTADLFRVRFFSALDVRTIIDLSPLRKELFGASSGPAVIAIFGRSEIANDEVLHVSPRRTPVAEIADCIAVPQQNIRRIPRSLAQTDPSIWKPLLWGGPADLALVRHLRETFSSLRSEADKSRWSDGAGFQVRGGAENDASHLLDLSHIATGQLRSMHLSGELQPPVVEAVMHRPRGRGIYLAPHVLMRKGFREFPEAAFLAEDATFTDGLSAIAADRSDEPRLMAIAALLNSSVARYWFLMTSSSWGVEREQLHHREWMSLPVPPLSEEHLQVLLKIVVDAGSGLPEKDWRPLLDRTAAEAYGLTTAERDVVVDALTVRWSELRSGWSSSAYAPPDDDHFLAYSAALSGHLDELDMGTWDVALTGRDHGLAMVTSRHRSASDSQRQANTFTIRQLVSDDARQEEDAWLSSATIVEPEALILEGSAVHLVKPDRVSCWMISSAQQAAADVFDGLLTGDATRDELQEIDA